MNFFPAGKKKKEKLRTVILKLTMQLGDTLKRLAVVKLIFLQLLSASTTSYAIRVIFSFILDFLLVSELFDSKIFNFIGNFDLAT